MANTLRSSKIKALLFDVGGVCVVSPLQAIQDYERKHNIPENWVNFAISRSGTQGAWQRLERGEIKLNDEEFFTHFRTDLHNPGVWDEYWNVFVKRRRGQKTTTANDAANGETPTRLSKTPPEIDSTTLFWAMMAFARRPDPIMYPTLRYLRSEHPDLVVAALSNTVPFPPDHPYSNPESPEQDPRSWFDLFVSSSEVGLRKPAREIYELALDRIRGLMQQRGRPAKIESSEVLFLDDIGENCKMGAKVGLQVIKVNLGRVEEAVAELGRRVFGIEDLVARVKEWERDGQKARSRL